MKTSQKLLVAILAVEATSSFAFGDLRQPSGLAFAALLVTVISLPSLAYAWCHADIRERAVPYPAGAPVLVGHLAPIGVPIYLFVTRRPLEATWGLAKAAAFAALYLGAGLAGTALHAQLFV